MPRFRRRPTEIEAVQYFRDRMHEEPLLGHPGIKGGHGGAQHFVITIHDQSAFLTDGDWVMPEPKEGRYYPCKPDVFNATYERVADLPNASAPLRLVEPGVVDIPKGQIPYYTLEPSDERKTTGTVATIVTAGLRATHMLISPGSHRLYPPVFNVRSDDELERLRNEAGAEFEQQFGVKARIYSLRHRFDETLMACTAVACTRPLYA